MFNNIQPPLIIRFPTEIVRQNTSLPDNSLTIKLPTELVKQYQFLYNHPIAKIILQILTQESGKAEKLQESFEDLIEFFQSDSDYFLAREFIEDPKKKPLVIDPQELWVKKIPFPQGTFSNSQEEFSINFVFRNGDFKSSTFHESNFVGDGKENKRKYYYFELYEDWDSKFRYPFLSIRTNLQGKDAELKAIEKREAFSGNQLKVIADRILFFLDPGVSDLYDASALILDTGVSYSKDKTPELSLKNITALISDDRSTFYSKIGYKIANFVGLKDFFYDTKPILIKQSAHHFHLAVEKVRNTTITEIFSKIYANKDSAQRTVMFLFNKYIKQSFKKEKRSSVQEWFGNATVHDLGKAIMEVKRKTDVSEVEMVWEINKDLIEFQKWFLTWKPFGFKVNKALSEYNLALDILFKHFIWTKDYTNPDALTDYQEFLQNPHPTFEEMIEGIETSTTLGWSDIPLEMQMPKSTRIRKFEISEVPTLKRKFEGSEAPKRPVKKARKDIDHSSEAPKKIEPPKKKTRKDKEISLEAPIKSSEAPVKVESMQHDPMQVILEEKWYDSPEEMIAAMPHRNTTTFKKKLDNLKSVFNLSKIDKDLSWTAWVTIPEGWNANPDQKETSLFMEIKEYEGSTIFTIREETKDENYMEIEIEESPVIYSILSTNKSNLDEFPSESISINKNSLEKFIEDIGVGSGV